MLSLKALETFYWVARLQGFHAAAERLRVTQPSVSYRIKELESETGRDLLVRSGRTLRLTAHGEALFHHAERMILAAQDLYEQFCPRTAIHGRFQLGVTDAFAVVCLPDLLRRLSREHPGLDIAVLVDDSHAITRKLDDGEVDVAVVSTPPMLPSIRYEPLGYQMAGWMAGPSHTPGRTVEPAWIAKQRIFVTPPPSNPDVLTAQWFGTIGLPVPRLSICNSMSAIIRLVEANVGLGILPTVLAERPGGQSKLRLLTVSHPLPQQRVFLAYSKGLLGAELSIVLQAVRFVVSAHKFCQ